MAKIVVFDDDVELAGDLAALLEHRGHAVTQIHREEGAVDSIAAAAPDIAILDVMFPENPSAGFDLARAIRENEKTKALPLILLTAVNQHFPMDFSAGDIDGEWMPVQDFMEKPVDIDALQAKIDALTG